MCTTLDRINAELLAFIKSSMTASAR